MIGDLRFVERKVYQERGMPRTVKILQMRYINKEGHMSDWEDVPLVEEVK
jgi:hypothetical protein